MVAPMLHVADLGAGNTPILAFAASLFAELPAPVDVVEVQVQYALGDADREDHWSEPDTLLVSRGGEIVASASV